MTGLESRNSTARSFHISNLPTMKLQTGLLHLDGRLSTAEDAATLLQGYAARPVELAGGIAEGSLFIAYRGDRIAFEEDFEVQPLQEGPYTLTWDGRLDNREELAGRLGLGRIESVPDPLVVLKAYQAFGDAIFADLI